MEKVITDNNSVASRFFPIKCKSGLYDFYPKQAAIAQLSFSLVVLTIIASYPRKTRNLHWCGNSKICFLCLGPFVLPIQMQHFLQLIICFVCPYSFFNIKMSYLNSLVFLYENRNQFYLNGSEMSVNIFSTKCILN